MIDDRIFANAEVERVARRRIAGARREILASLEHISNGNPLASEPSRARRVDRLQTKAQLSRSEAEMISSAIDMAASAEGAEARAKLPGAEAIQGATLDFVGVAFFERGRRAADAVGRVSLRQDDRPQGSGFLVAPGLFLTNHHVLETAADAMHFQVEFDYEIDGVGGRRAVSAFEFDPTLCFVSDGIEGLDYTLVGMGERRRGTRGLESFGFISLSDARDKHMLGEVANVIQHPDGRYKEVVLRENHLVARDDTEQVLHYVADTEQGSSGSPVFNNEWQPIALHHWAGPYREVVGRDGRMLSSEINEGIRISAIVKDLARKGETLDGPDGLAVRRALDAWVGRGPRRNAVPQTDAGRRGEAAPADAAPASRRDAEPAGAKRHDDGSITWTFPIEINVRAPLIAGRGAATEGATESAVAKLPDRQTGPGAEAVAAWRQEDFSDRAGYEPGFLPGHIVPMPVLKQPPGRAARNILTDAADPDPEEFRYHHFSVKLNADRGLCYFTAANIDGSRLKRVDRDDGTVKDDPTLADFRAEGLTMDRFKKGADFTPDRRVKPGELMTQHFYEKQKIEGVDSQADQKEFMARMYQRGHIVLRGDIGWGSTAEARAADRDSYFFTNICPQVGAFNMGVDPDGNNAAGGKLHWREVETYVLRNALVDRRRVCVFAGPIFDEKKDLPYRFGSKVPLRYWKVAAWAENGALRTVALLADQSPLIEIRPEALGPEGFADPAELARLKSFLSTVAEIEALTGLDFGTALRKADIRAGTGAETAVAGFPAGVLGREGAREAKTPRQPKGRKARKSDSTKAGT